MPLASFLTLQRKNLNYISTQISQSSASSKTPPPPHFLFFPAVPEDQDLQVIQHLLWGEIETSPTESTLRDQEARCLLHTLFPHGRNHGLSWSCYWARSFWERDWHLNIEIAFLTHINAITLKLVLFQGASTSELDPEFLFKVFWYQYCHFTGVSVEEWEIGLPSLPSCWWKTSKIMGFGVSRAESESGLHKLIAGFRQVTNLSASASSWINSENCYQVYNQNFAIIMDSPKKFYLKKFLFTIFF